MKLAIMTLILLSACGTRTNTQAPTEPNIEFEDEGGHTLKAGMYEDLYNCDNVTKRPTMYYVPRGAFCTAKEDGKIKVCYDVNGFRIIARYIARLETFAECQESK